MARPRKYATSAERQAAYRARQSAAFDIAPGFGKPDGYSWSVSALNGSVGLCVALCKSEHEAKAHLLRVAPLMRPGVILSISHV